jgi:arabinan endo-1,5-alpha-L-arabinosidase
LFNFSKPVWNGYFADPFILKCEDGYFAYGTGDHRHFERKTAFDVLFSKDLVRWSLKSRILEKSEFPSYWAPEVARSNNQFFLYYSAGGSEGEGHHIRVAASDKPDGPFEDIGPFQFEQNEKFSIDAHPFQDPKDGQWYLFFCKDFFDERVGTGIAVVTMTKTMRSAIGPSLTVLRASQDWQIFEQNRFWYNQAWSAWHTVEGPSVVCRDNQYYCFYSGGLWKGENYGVSFARSAKVLGPYTEPFAEGPTVLKTSVNGLFGPGHNSIVVGPDNLKDVIVYHAWDEQRAKRQMYIDVLEWALEGPRVAKRKQANGLYN